MQRLSRSRTRWTVGRMLAAGFAIALVALGVVGASAYSRIGTLLSAQHPLGRSHAELGAIGKLGDLVNVVDRTQRGYLYEHSAASLQLYRDSATSLRDTLDQVLNAADGDPVQQRLAARIGTLVEVAAPPDEPTTGHDQQFNEITGLVDAMHDREVALVDERLQAIDDSARRTRLLIVAVSVGTALLVAAAGRWITHRITSAAHEVTAAAGRVIEADLSRPAIVTGPSELAQMAMAVNSSMTAMAAARDEALAATAAKSAFLAAMSHEIRTPMNAVIGGTSLLDDGTLTADQRELVQIVRGSAESLLVIINDILDFSKIEAGELVLDEQPVDLRGMIDDAVNLVALTADAKGLRLSVSSSPECPLTVVADETRMRQILVNLLGNAVKFTDLGGVDVRVSTRPLEDPLRVRLCIAVSDTGIGIAEDQLARLFAAFAQVDSSATRKRDGSGLGLVISRRLAEAMGGTITVASVPGEGSTFTVEAPVGVAEDATVSQVARAAIPTTAASGAAVAPDAVPGAEASGAAIGHGELRILLAEDNPINQRVAELMLTRRGHHVDIVDNGADAVRAVHDVAYDLVLMDVRMPSMDGLEATERIHAYPPGHGAPRIVALTANATVDDQAAGRRAGMDGFLAKPIQEIDLDVALAVAAGRADLEAVFDRPAEVAPTGEDDDVRTSVAAIAGSDFANQLRLADILIAFARRMPVVLAEMDEAIAEENHDRVDRLAHGLKGSAATLGARRLAGACARLEAYAQQHDAFGAGAALQEVRERAEVAERAVVTVSQELAASST